MTIRRIFGFEADQVFLAGEGMTFTGAIEYDTSVVHRTLAGWGSNQSLRFNGSGTIKFAGRSSGDALDEFHIAVWRESVANTFYVRTLDSTGTAQAAVTWDTDGQLRIRRGSFGGGVLVNTAAPSAGAWHTYKVVWTCREAAASGRIQVFVDGSSTAYLDTGASVDCRNTSVNDFLTVEIGVTGSAGYNWIDCFVWGSTGTIPNEPLFVHPLAPTSDGATAQLTPSSGSDHWSVVDDYLSVSTADYVDTSTAGDEDHYGHGGLGASPPTILALKVCGYGAGDGTLTNQRTLVKSGGTTTYGTNQAVASGTYSTVSDVYTTDPATGVAWTASGLDAALFGVEVNT